MTIQEMLGQHTIVDIDDYVHVIDGKVICYVLDTIDFENAEQVKNLFEMVSKLFADELYPERYGHGNTRLVIAGDKSSIRKHVYVEGMHHFPPELKEKVQQAITEYRNKELKTMSISDMMSKHTIVDINECLHVIDGKVIYYAPDTIDFESEKQVENLLGMATDLFVNDFFTEKYGHGNTMLVISGCKEYVDKYINIDDMVHVPPDIMKKVREAIEEYESRTGNRV